MGQEFAQLREWSEERELDWFLLAEEPASADEEFWVKALLHLYKRIRHCMSRIRSGKDLNGSMQMMDTEVSIVLSDIQRARRKNLLFVCNFTPVARDDYRVGVPKETV